MTSQPHPWNFPRSIRPNAFGWRSSKLAASRLREATAEIRAVARIDPVLGADGAVRLLERIGPAFQDIDTSSGSLSTATNKIVTQMIDLICAARPAPTVRAGWVERLEHAIEQDAMGWLHEVDARRDEIARAGRAEEPAMPLGVSVSKTFLAFVAPVMDAVADHPDARAALLQTAQLVWNAVVLEDHGDPTWLVAVRERIGARPEAALIEALVAAKRAHFAMHRWLVRDCGLFERDGELRLRVEAGEAPRAGGPSGA